jgi:hypothetical protein
MRFYQTLILVTILSIFSSCRNDELAKEVESYCNCLSKNVLDPDGRLDCIEMMEELLLKYEKQPRNKAKIIELVGDCNI